MSWALLLRCALLLSCLGAAQAAPPPAVQVGPSPGALADTYFGMHIHRVARGDPPTPWPATRFGAFRLWDTGVMWTHLEPQKGQWHFEQLDQIVNVAQANGADLVMTLGIPPPWAASRPQENFVYGLGGNSPPRDMADWENYVRTLALRYKGRIRYWELWNEPTFDEIDKGNGFYRGSVDTMVELGRIAHRVLKEVDPANRLATPAFTDEGPRLDLYLSRGGKAYTDFVAQHFYAEKPEQYPSRIAHVRAVMQKHGIAHLPLWNTESGYALASVQELTKNGPRDAEELAGFIARAQVLGAAAGLERFYWYAWETLLKHADPASGANPALLAYTQTLRWLRGTTVRGCRSEDRRLWICELSMGKRRAFMVWHTQDRPEWQPPAEWQALQYETLDGRLVKLQPGQQLPLGPAPLLVKTDALLWSVYQSGGKTSTR